MKECKKLKNRQIGRDEYFKLDKKNFNFICKSPLSQAYFVMDKILPGEHKIFRKRKVDVLKPVPCYSNMYPSNMNIFGMDKMFINPRFKSKSEVNDPILWEFYTDGSCMPNPGPGGSGYFSNDFKIKSKIDTINHDTTINYCELNGIRMVLEDCLQDMGRFKQMKKFINIYTDSQFVLDQLDIQHR